MARSVKTKNSGRKDGKFVKAMNDKKFTRSNSSRNQRREKEAIDTMVDVSRSNPFSWYDKFPQYTKDAGTLAFGMPLGANIRPDNMTQMYIPGVMRLSYLPGIGVSRDLNSPINRSAIRFYTYMRSIQKAAASYDSADVMIYLMALDSCYAFHSMMKRAYGVAQLFTPLNRYYPKQLFKYMGFDESILSDLARFRAYINRFGLSLGSYTMPANFDITSRHQWMCEGIYVDSESTRAQTYFFSPEGFWQYNNTVTTGSQLDFIRWNETDDSTTLHTLDQVIKFGDNLITHILNDEDTGRISGDMYIAFKEKANVKTLSEVPDGYMVLPVYDKVVLTQIENATICGLPADDIKITQNPSVNNGAILFIPEFKKSKTIGMGWNSVDTYRNWVDKYLPTYANGYTTFINMRWDNPTPADVIEATRLHTKLESTEFVNDKSSPTETSTWKASTAPADSITRVTVIQFVNESQTRSMNLFTNFVGMSTLPVEAEASTHGLLTPTLEYNAWLPADNKTYYYQPLGIAMNMAASCQALAMCSVFDWSPMLVIAEMNTATYSGRTHLTYNPIQMACDVDNIVPLTQEKAQRLNDASMLSLFDVPQMGW